MEILNQKTQKAQSFIRAYMNSKWSSLNEKYKTKCSQKKQDIEKEILKEAQKYNAQDSYRILSASQTYFSCGYRIERDLIVHTPCHRYTIPDVFEN